MVIYSATIITIMILWYTAKEDYAISTSLVFNVVISAGSTSSPFSIDIVNDMIQESIETFDITIRLLRSCSSISLGTSSAKVMIIDDDDGMIILKQNITSLMLLLLLSLPHMPREN